MRRFLNMTGWVIFDLIMGFYIGLAIFEPTILGTILDTASFLTILFINLHLVKYGRGIDSGLAALLVFSVQLPAYLGPGLWREECPWWTGVADLILLAYFYSDEDG